MKKIYVLDEQGNLQAIDAGITEYKELEDGPITISYKGVKLTDSTLSVDSEGALVVQSEEGHMWTEDEVMLFCNSAPTGKYDIRSAIYGTEWLIIDDTIADMGKRFRRITADQDFIYDEEAGWITISDTSARGLIFKITNDIPNAIVVGNSLVLDCYYYSTVGNGTITITKGERTVAVAALQIGKTTSISLTNEVTDGVQEFKYVVTNNGFGSLEKQVTGTVGLTGIQLTYTPTFNSMQIKSGTVNFPVKYSGTGVKYVSFTITNAEGEVSYYQPDTTLKDSSGTYTFQLDGAYFSHGENHIETYLYMKDGDSDDILTRTDPLSYDFPYNVDNTPIVITYFDYTTLNEWDTVSIPYRIWSAANENAESIKFELMYTQINSEGETTTQYMNQEYDNSQSAYFNNYLTSGSEHKWQISNVPHGVLNFRIYLNGNNIASFEKTGVIVAESDYNFNTIDGYLFNFAANNITDTKPFSVWESNGRQLTLSGFNWTTDGIKTEENKSLNFASTAKAIYEGTDDLIALAGGDSGTTFEVDFKVSENAINNEPIIRYGSWNEERQKWDNNWGLIVYPTKAVLNYDEAKVGDNLVVNYQKGERINLGVTIEPDEAASTNRYIKIYINGIISKIIHYVADTKFASGLNRFEFNCSNNEFDLYSFRAYNEPLTSNQMLQNYISNFASTDTKVQMLSANNIFTDEPLVADGEELSGEYIVDFNKTKSQIGVLVLITDTLPESKTYVNCHTIYYEKDENNPEVEWDVDNGRSMATTYYYKDGSLNKAVKVCAQGTSSLEYPRKNFKIKFKDKFYIKGHENGRDKTITCKAD